MRFAAPALSLAALSLVCPALQPAAEAQTRAKVDLSKIGPKVGQLVPDFELQDQNGRKQELRSIMGPKGAMLVFHRSADWWPYCKTQLVELQEKSAELRAKGFGVAAISYDSADVLAAFSRQRGITFPLLSDAGSRTIRRYGLLNTVVDEALGPNREDPAVKSDAQTYISPAGARPMMAGIAFPGTLMLDQNGRVTARFFEDYYVERSTVSSILIRAGARAAKVNATKVSTPHLVLVTYPSDAEVVPGNRFSLVAEITPASGIHVYAPGAEGYRVVNLNIEPKHGIRLLPIRYPASEVYFFKPLNERVPVFQRPFNLVQEVVLEGTREAQAALRGKTSVTLTGTLQYQACDDMKCFNPVSLPLTWNLSLRPLVVERLHMSK